MKSRLIKVGHIYYVQFNPVQGNEFAKQHLAVVLKKNADNSTFVVVPLTSSSMGDGVNKICIGKITALPERLSGRESYAVYDQIRTVDAQRFSMVFDDSGNAVQVPFPNGKWKELLRCVISDLIRDTAVEERIENLSGILDKNHREYVQNCIYVELKKHGSITAEQVHKVNVAVAALDNAFTKLTQEDIGKITSEILNIES